MEMNSTISSPSDWVQFYQRTLTDQGVAPVSSVADATTTTTTSPTITTTGTSNTGHLNPEGRVSKPTRRRRASRAAPTTLVNTDTTNFRAMVQQFTGASNPSLSFGTRNDAQSIDFRTMSSQNSLNTNVNMMPQGHGYRNPYIQQQQHQQQQHQHHHQQQQQQRYMYSLENRSDGFVSGLNNTRPSLESSDGFLMGNTSSQMFPRSSTSNNNRSNGYIQ